MNILLAISLQVIGSVLFAAGAMLQSTAVRAEFDPAHPASQNRLSFAKLLRQFTKPRWLGGLLCVLGGAGLHLVALTMAPVALVQPIGILAVPWSVLLAARIFGHRIPGKVWQAVALTIIGVVGFTVFSALFATGSREEFAFDAIVTSFLVVVLVCGALSLVALRAPGWAKAMLWATVGAVLYGLASGMMKSAMNLVQRHGHDVFTTEVLVVVGFMLICYILGVWMIQQGYASGPPEITVGTMTTVDPFVAVVFGLVVLGEGIGMPVMSAVAMVVFFAVAVHGVTRLSSEHPDALEERNRIRAGAGPSLSA